MTFLTRASKHEFPKWSAKMINGTEKYAKRTARYNEFRYKTSEAESFYKSFLGKNTTILSLLHFLFKKLAGSDIFLESTHN